MSTIPDDHLRNVCKPGEGKKTCIYISVSADGFECAKTNPAIKNAIDARTKTMHAKSVNCEGL